MFMAPLIQGFGMGASLIAAIGAQNAFVMKQGLKHQHLFMTAITCFICDTLLIILGVTGVGVLIADIPMLDKVMRIGGAIFLTFYALRSFWNVFHPHALIVRMDKSSKGKMATFLALLGFTFLNPHTYIDTMLILGSVGAENPHPEQIYFIIGAAFASLIWFFGLTYGASKLRPLFRNPRAWQVLDTIMGFVMLALAYSLVN